MTPDTPTPDSKIMLRTQLGVVMCDTLEQVSQAYVEHRDRSGLGAGCSDGDECFLPGEGRVNGRVAYRVSYNGRVWDADTGELVHDNRD